MARVAVESFHLPVLQGAVGADELVGGAEGRDGCGHVGGFAVAEVVVGDDPLGARGAGVSESGGGAGTPRSGAFLVGQDLAVGVAGVVVEGDVDIVDANLDCSVPVRTGLGAAVSLSAADVGDSVNHFDVHLEQFPGRLPGGWAPEERRRGPRGDGLLGASNLSGDRLP